MLAALQAEAETGTGQASVQRDLDLLASRWLVHAFYSKARQA
jgi:hypothetical protein